MDDRKVETPALPSAETTTQEAGEPALLVGDGIGPYRIVSLLGEGGMGRVYLADDTRLERRVAIKVMTSSRVPGASLLREARMGARLHHANIATVYDVLEAGGRLHIVMEHLEGRSLARLLAEVPLTPARAASVAARILAAVGHAHAVGVIHCDLKPANVFVLPDDAIKVLDFGLARLDEPSTHTHSSMGLAGTPRYMAPERLLGAHPGPQTDVYSVGVILSEMLRRPQPSAAADAAALPPRTDDATLHAALLTVADAATAPDPARRYRSAAEMAAALDRACQGRRAGGSRPFITRKGAVASGFLTVTAALLVSLLLGSGMPAPRPVVGVSLSAIGADPISAHMAAALQQLLEHTLSGAKDLTMIRRLPGQPDEGDLGATHMLSGTVERSGPDLRVVLSVADADGDVLASHQMTSPLEALSTLGTLFAEGASTVMERARLPVERATAGDPAARQALSIDTQAFEEYAQARMYMRSPDMAGSLDYAIGLLQRAVERDSSFVLAHAGLAEAYWQKYLATRDNAWTDRARASALDAIRLNPDDPLVRYTLAVIYRGSGRAEDALSEVTRAIDLQPANDDHYRLRGRLHAESGRLDRALADLNTALSLRPGYWENYRAIGLILFDAGRYAESIPHFRRVTELRPSSAAAFQTLGVAHHAANQMPEALQAYEKALSIAPGANTYGNIAKIHYDSGRFEQARRAYEESIRLQPKEPVTHRNLGDTLQRLGLDARARTAYETAIALGDETLKVNPSSLGVISLQALCYAKLGNAAEARRLADTVISSPHPQAFARYRAGVALVLIGDSRGIDEVVTAIAEGHSRSEAALDVDLASVRGDSRLAAALAGQPR